MCVNWFYVWFAPLKVEQHKQRALNALMKGLDDDQAAVQHGIILQSLLGLSKLLSSLKNDYPASLFISIALGMKPFFEKVRRARLHYTVKSCRVTFPLVE